MTKDEILTRLIKDGHISLEEFRVLDTTGSQSVAPVYPVIPFNNPVPFDPGPPPPYVRPQPWYTNPTPYCAQDLRNEYVVGVDPINSKTGNHEIHTYKFLWEQVPSGLNPDKPLIIKPKTNES